MSIAQENTSRRRLLCLMTAAIITSLLFYLGAQPFAAGFLPEPWDKLAHLLCFGLISWLLSVGSSGRMPLLLIFTVAGIGALDEWRQSLLPGRSMDLFDLLTDVIAASITVIALQAGRSRSV